PPVKLLRRMPVRPLPCPANTRSIVAEEIFNDLATAKALGFAGTDTNDVSTNSCLENRDPLHGSLLLSGAASIGRKPTDTAFKIPHSTSARISSMRGDVPLGASSKVPRKVFASPSMRTLRHLPMGKSARWPNSAIGFLLNCSNSHPPASI